MSKKPIIVFEGIEGSGKSHHISKVTKFLDKKKINYVKIREPGGSLNSEKIRSHAINLAKENDKDPNNFYLEFGVFSGTSINFFSENINKNIYGFDSFEGLKEDWLGTSVTKGTFDLKKKIPNKVDVIYLDSLHEAKHVEKIFYQYFDYLKIEGIFFIDDISWLPYLKNCRRDNFYCEINNKETFEKLLQIYNFNQEKFDIYFTFISSGMCKIVKKQDLLNKTNKFSTREFSLKNLIRRLLK